MTPDQAKILRDYDGTISYLALQAKSLRDQADAIDVRRQRTEEKRASLAAEYGP
jgi:hypothetical protein